MIKRILIFVIILSLAAFISSCREKDKTIGEKPVIGELEYVEMIDSLDIHIVSGRIIEEEYLAKAAEEFKKLFGVDIKIDLDLAIDISGVKTSRQLSVTGASGLYLFPYVNAERIHELSQLGEILAFDELLEDNEVWNTLPEGMKNLYVSDDGKVWAIPRSYNKIVESRIFRADYLKELEMEMPDNLDSLYEVSLALAGHVRAGSASTDTIGMMYVNAYSLRDIFYANGVPVNKSNDSINNTSISYNPEYGSFEDSMLMKDMEVTLDYILKLRNDGITRQMRGSSYRSGFGSTLLENDRIANVYQQVPDEVFTDDRFSVSPGINGLKTSMLIPLTCGVTDGFYVLGSNTENAKAVANYFVSRFYGDLETYLFASRGIPGELYEYSSETGEVRVLNYAFFTPGAASMIGDNPVFQYEDIDITFDYTLAGGAAALSQLKQRSLALNEYISEGLSKGLIYELPVVKAYPEVFKAGENEIINSAAGTIFDNQFNRLMSGRVAASEAIATYKKDMKITGMQDIINELNRRIGAKTMFSY